MKGGPCLHIVDRKIIDDRSISISDLFTIRQGEPARDNILDRIGPAKEDIIKIKSRPGSTACLFYAIPDHSCGIYASRPLECRILSCADPEEIIAVYDKQRLSREDLLKNNQWLWELVSAHQQMCDYEKITRLVRDKKKDTLTYLTRYDQAYRDLMIEKGDLDRDILDFLIGVPLEITIRRYGME